MRGPRVLVFVGAVLALAVSALVPPPATAQPAPPVGWQYNPATGHLYEAAIFPTWVEGEAYAVSLGGHLVTINDGAEQAWLDDTYGDLGYWIGLNDRAVEGTMVWSSGEPVTYQRWIYGEPNNGTSSECPGGEDVVQREWYHIFGEGWNDVCDLGFGGWAMIEVPFETVLDDMVSGGQLPNEGVAGAVSRLAEKSTTNALTKYLGGLVRGGRITQDTMDEILSIVN